MAAGKQGGRCQPLSQGGFQWLGDLFGFQVTHSAVSDFLVTEGDNSFEEMGELDFFGCLQTGNIVQQAGGGGDVVVAEALVERWR